MTPAFVASLRNVIPTDIRPAFNKTKEVCLLFILFLVIMLFAHSSGADAELLPPQNLVIVDGGGGGSELTLAWDASVELVEGYKVYWGLASHFYDHWEDAGFSTSYTLTGLPLAPIYSAVTAYGNGIESDYSNEVNTVPIPPSIIVLGTGILGLGLWSRQRKRT